MSNIGWKKVRTHQHPARPDLAFDLEIHQDTLEFRMKMREQVFTGRDGGEVLKQAGDYLQNLPIPGNWQPMIHLARYSTRMEAERLHICIEKSGLIIQHPWVQASGPREIELTRITQLRYHTMGFDLKIPPCAHNDGLSSYYHLPYTPEVWKQIRVLVWSFNQQFTKLNTFLNMMSVPLPHEAWEAHFLEQWLSFFEQARIKERISQVPE